NLWVQPRLCRKPLKRLTRRRKRYRLRRLRAAPLVVTRHRHGGDHRRHDGHETATTIAVSLMTCGRTTREPKQKGALHDSASASFDHLARAGSFGGISGLSAYAVCAVSARAPLSRSLGGGSHWPRTIRIRQDASVPTTEPAIAIARDQVIDRVADH